MRRKINMKLRYTVYTHGIALCTVSTKKQAHKVAHALLWIGKENIKIVKVG